MPGPHLTFDDAPNTCVNVDQLRPQPKSLHVCFSCINSRFNMGIQLRYVLLRVQMLAIICEQAKHNRFSDSNTTGLLGPAALTYMQNGLGRPSPYVLWNGTGWASPYVLWNELQRAELHRADAYILWNQASQSQAIFTMDWVCFAKHLHDWQTH